MRLTLRSIDQNPRRDIVPQARWRARQEEERQVVLGVEQPGRVPSEWQTRYRSGHIRSHVNLVQIRSSLWGRGEAGERHDGPVQEPRTEGDRWGNEVGPVLN